MNNFSDKADFIWKVANLIRDTFKRGKYQDVILPFIVLRRIDCVLEPTKDAVLEKYDQYKDKLKDLSGLLCSASHYAFYNTSQFTFERLLNDAPNLKLNLIDYLNNFSQNMREVLENFGFRNTINELEDAELLYSVMEHFKNIDLHPAKVSNIEMGYIFEELIRKFNEALNENPGEHFTPREVIRLMVSISIDKDPQIGEDQIVRKVYDPCCGTGGMLTTAKDLILARNPNANVRLYGQEVNKETFAVCKSDLYMKSRDGRDAENILFGSTLSRDRHSHERFHYVFANPPYGKDWKRDEKDVRDEADLRENGRFEAGLPSTSDGQLLFLQNMLAHMYKPTESSKDGEPTQVAIVMNGSPLFTGDAGSSQSESEIRRWIIENDWLEAIVALPEQLFYNTGISTYIWILSNHKAPARRGKVQLINASDLWKTMPKSMGDKRREISQEQIDLTRQIFKDFAENERSKIFPYRAFGYRKIVVERPLRLNFQASPERIALLDEQKAFADLAVSKKKNPEEKQADETEGRALQATIRRALQHMPGDLYKDRPTFDFMLDRQLKSAGLKLAAPLTKAIYAALSERDETAEICRDKQKRPEPDPDLRDTENVPLALDGNDPLCKMVFDGYSMFLHTSVSDFFTREVKPYVPDAWISPDSCDIKDQSIGRVGYKVNFNRYFYRYQPPRSLNEIEADIKVLERDILEMLKEVAG